MKLYSVSDHLAILLALTIIAQRIHLGTFTHSVQGCSQSHSSLFFLFFSDFEKTIENMKFQVKEILIFDPISARRQN